MWRLLRECFPDARFRRQVPLRHFTVDFASHKLKLAIEIDGGQHGGAKEEARTALIEAEGYRVVRFWNHDVLGNGGGVATMLARYCDDATPTQPSPIEGEGFIGGAHALAGKERDHGASELCRIAGGRRRLGEGVL